MNTRRHRPLIARQLTQLLVVAILLGSLPMVASPVIAEHESPPAFTLDICHPPPVFAIAAASCTLATFTAYSLLITIDDRGQIEIPDLTFIDRAREAPNPPPPKTPA